MFLFWKSLVGWESSHIFLGTLWMTNQTVIKSRLSSLIFLWVHECLVNISSDGTFDSPNAIEMVIPPFYDEQSLFLPDETSVPINAKFTLQYWYYFLQLYVIRLEHIVIGIKVISTVDIMILLINTTYHSVNCCLTYFIPLVRMFSSSWL